MTRLPLILRRAARCVSKDPARATTTPCPRAGLADGSDPDSLIAPVGLTSFSAHPELPAPAQAGVEPFAYRVRAMAAELDRATALFGFTAILIAVLWFATASLGASLP